MAETPSAASGCGDKLHSQTNLSTGDGSDPSFSPVPHLPEAASRTTLSATLVADLGAQAWHEERMARAVSPRTAAVSQRKGVSAALHARPNASRRLSRWF